MKKVLMLVVAIMFVAGSAFAMEQISDNSMDSITGQAGVSIAVDDVKIYQHITGLWYTDTDGLQGATTDPASVGIEDLKVMVDIQGIVSADTTANTIYSPGTALVDNDLSAVGYNAATFVAKALTIDVTSQLPILSAGLEYNNNAFSLGYPVTNVAGVLIGLPTIEIAQTQMSLVIGVNDDTPLDSSSSLVAANTGKTYGTVNIGTQVMTILDGTLEIAPH